MQTLISGKNLDIGEALHNYIEQSVRDNVKKYFDSVIRVHVTLAKEGHHFKGHLIKTHIIVHEGTGNKVLIKGSGLDADPYQSVNDAIKKMAKQLARYKGKLKHHHVKSSEKEVIMTKYTITPFDEKQEVTEENEVPLIIAEKETTIYSFSVSDAVMHMDLMNLTALLFINKSTHKLNLIYYRKDGNIAWVDANISM